MMRTANFKSAAIAALLSMGLLTGCTNGITNQKTSNHMDTLNLTQEWDKKFPQSDKVNPVSYTHLTLPTKLEV